MGNPRMRRPKHTYRCYNCNTYRYAVQDWKTTITFEFQSFQRRDEIKNKGRIPKDPPFANKERLTNRLSFSDEREAQPIRPFQEPREKQKKALG